MTWTERQRRMLAELGLPPWLAPAEAGVDAVEEPDSTCGDDAESPSGAHVPQQPREAHLSPPFAPAADSDAAIPASAYADMGWVELRKSVEACSACGLCQGRTRTVFGVGHPAAHWMIVGEAPGEQEDRQGEPFVGRSGQLLDNMLRALGLTRDEATADRQVFIANTLKCRPPGNRNPTAEELATCEPFLIRQVALVKPRIILAMGRFAVQSLLRSTEPIGRLRGRLHHYQGVPLVVTYHPAYLLRNPLEKARAWDDLCLAASTLAVADEASATAAGAA